MGEEPTDPTFWCTRWILAAFAVAWVFHFVFWWGYAWWRNFRSDGLDGKL